jgi:hypothetical protein
VLSGLVGLILNPSINCNTGRTWSVQLELMNCCWFADPPRLEKSPLLANGYNHPPTHLNHMQFMQLNHHPAAAHTAILSPAGIPHHGLARADGSIIKNQSIPGMDAIAR